jgi:hypothetical protein
MSNLENKYNQEDRKKSLLKLTSKNDRWKWAEIANSLKFLPKKLS